MSNLWQNYHTIPSFGHNMKKKWVEMGGTEVTPEGGLRAGVAMGEGMEVVEMVGEAMEGGMVGGVDSEDMADESEAGRRRRRRGVEVEVEVLMVVRGGEGGGGDGGGGDG